MRNADEKAVAVLRGSSRPDAEQEKRFEKNEVAMVRLHVDF